MTDSLPELKQIIGALLFAAKHPVSIEQIRKTLRQTAETHGGETESYAKVDDDTIRAALQQIQIDLKEMQLGIEVSEVAHGFRLENEVVCGRWIRHLLERGKPTRLSRPALETLAIVAYRQPCVRSEIEAVRGVAVDQIVRNLLEMQLLRIVGRSELPGRPMMYGTTQKFLEHFGLKDIDDLPGIEELRRIEHERIPNQEEDGEKTEEVQLTIEGEEYESGRVAEED